MIASSLSLCPSFYAYCTKLLLLLYTVFLSTEKFDDLATNHTEYDGSMCTCSTDTQFCYSKWTKQTFVASCMQELFFLPMVLSFFVLYSSKKRKCLRVECIYLHKINVCIRISVLYVFMLAKLAKLSIC